MTTLDMTKGDPPAKPGGLRAALTGDRTPAAVDTGAPLRPEWARDRQTFAVTARAFLGRNTYRARRWAMSAPVVVALLVLYSPRGLARVVATLGSWVYDSDSAELRHKHAGGGDTAEYAKAQAVRKANLHARWLVAGTLGAALAVPALAWTFPAVLSGIIGVAVAGWVIKVIPGRGLTEVLVALVAGGLTWGFLPAALVLLPRPPAWPFVLVAVAAVLALGWHGRPRGKQIARPVELKAHMVEPLRSPVVTEALCELGNPRMKEPTQIRLLSDPVRAGQGYQMDLELPRGVPAAYVVGRREAFASGIRRELGCVFLSVGPRHPGHLVVFVSDMPMAQTPQAAWPLLKGGAVDIFRPVPMFTDQRGEWVNLTFAYASLIIGALPRMGKTFLLRQALLVAGLDRRTKVYALDGKGTGDLASTQVFAHFYSRGAKPEEIERVRAMVRELRAEILKRADIIDSLTREECPESKVTSELADKRRDLCPIVVGIDETQSYFEYGDEGNKAHKAIRQELAAGITELVKLGPALGIIVILASQNVTATTIPRPISTNAAFRACLKVADQIANDQILGTSAYSQGLDATQLDYTDKGVLYLRADGALTRVVRTVAGLDAVAAEPIAARARAYRDGAGLLTGDAAGEQAGEEAAQVDLLADVRDVMDHPAVPSMHLAELREALELLRPTTWGHLDNAALGSLLRAAGVRVATVWSAAAKKDGKGVKRAWLDIAATDDEDPGEEDGGAVVALTR